MGELHHRHLVRREPGSEVGHRVDRRFVEHELIWVGLAVGSDGGCLTPDEARPRRSEAVPPAPDEVRRRTIGLAIPALHGQHGPAVRDSHLATRAVRNRQRLRVSAIGCDRIGGGNFDPERVDVVAERVEIGQSLHLRVAGHQSIASSRSAISRSTSRSASGRTGTPAGTASVATQSRSFRNMAALWR